MYVDLERVLDVPFGGLDFLASLHHLTGLVNFSHFWSLFIAYLPPISSIELKIWNLVCWFGIGPRCVFWQCGLLVIFNENQAEKASRLYEFTVYTFFTSQESQFQKAKVHDEFFYIFAPRKFWHDYIQSAFNSSLQTQLRRFSLIFSLINNFNLHLGEK